MIVGIYSGGESTSNPNVGTVITQNDFSATGTDRISKNAVVIINEAQPSVTYNKVYIMNTASTDVVGLSIGSRRAYSLDVASGGISGAMVSNNVITGVVNSETIGYSTAGISISGTASGQPNTVQNNMVGGVTGQAKSDYHVAGIWVVGAVASVTKLYNNTVSLTGDRGSQTGQSPSYGIALTGLDPSLDMKNNIISNNQIVTGGGLVKSFAFGTLSTTFVNLDSDYNVFYSAGVQDGGFRSGSLFTNLGTSYATLADWQTAISDDAHSIEVAPVFVSATDLHLLAGSNPVLQATPGLPVASVTTDIDCNPRNIATPAIGAQEINVSGYSISAGAGTGGTITPAGSTSVAVGGNQSYTITANCGYVISDVLVDGISQGAITTYTFSNVSASHTITATYTAQLPTITAAGSTTFCVGGSVVLTSSSASGNIWSTGETTQSITAQASGNYWVAVNNGSCNSQQSAPVTITITAPAAAPTVTANNSLTFCQGGSVTLTSSALTGNLWSNGATTRAITVSASGDYSVIYNNGGCNSAPSAVSTVTVNPLPATPTISASGSTTLCTGGNVVLTSSSATGNTWSTGATTQSITVSAAGNYTVRVSNGTCSSAISDITTVTVNTIPARPTITVTGATSFCEGGSTILTSSATTGNLWSNGETTQAITVTASGIYTVTSTVNGCTSTTSAGRLINVNPTPVLLVTNPAPVCAPVTVDITLPQVTAGSTGGGTLTYWTDALATATLLNPNAIIVSGTYYIKSSVGTCSDIEPVVVTVNAAPITPTINANGSTTFCTGGSVVLTSSATTGNVWSNGATTQAITVSSTGNYSVVVTTNGCSSASSTDTVVTVNAIPSSPTISASGTTTFCTGGEVTLTSSSATGNVWSTGATTQSITVSTAGNYSVAVTASGCTSATSANTAVTVNPIPATPTIAAGSATTFCTGGSVTLTSSSATGNVWSTGATTQSITVSTAGNYSVAVTASGCTSATSANTAVTVNSIPATPTIAAGSATTFCTGGSVTLTSSATTGNLWSTGATTQSITVSTAGNYSVAVTTSGCTSGTSADTIVAVNPIPATPTITAGSATTFCTGGSVTLTSSSATGNVWSTGATTQSITVSTAGNYSVAVTASGCTSATSANTAVTVNSIPATPTIAAGSATAFCTGGSVTLTSSATIGNLWSTGATTQSITVSTAGNYSVAVTTSGCTSGTSADTIVAVNPIPATPTITAGSATTFCTGGSVTLTSSSATGNVWSTGATTPSITVLAAGNYSVSVTSNGCSSSDSAGTTVSVNQAPNNEVTQSQGIITATQTGASYQWFMCPNTLIDGATSQTYTPLVVGNYKVMVTLGTCALTSECITVTELGTNDFDVRKFKLYPNPVTNILNLEYTDEMSEVSVFNMLGQNVFNTRPNTTSIQIDMSRLPSATYMVQVRSEKCIKNV